MDRLSVRAFEPPKGCLAGPHGDMETSSEHSVIEATGTQDIGFQKRGWSRAPAVAAGQHRWEIKLNPTLGPGQRGLTVSVWGPAWPLGCLHSSPGSEGSGPVSELQQLREGLEAGWGARAFLWGPRPSSSLPRGPNPGDARPQILKAPGEAWFLVRRRHLLATWEIALHPLALLVNTRSQALPDPVHTSLTSCPQRGERGTARSPPP